MGEEKLAVLRRQKIRFHKPPVLRTGGFFFGQK